MTVLRTTRLQLRPLRADDIGLAAGLNIVHGAVVHPAVAHELGLPIAA